MEIDIASAIEEMLDRRETVCIEGIGSLTLENLSAKFSKDGKTMSPPSAHLTYYDTQTKNKPLRKYLAKKYGLSKEDAQSAIAMFSQSVLTALDKKKEVNIEGILKFEKKGGKVKMTPLKGYLEKYYKGLPIVPAKKLKKKNKSEEKKTKQTKQVLPKFKVKAAQPNPKFAEPKFAEPKVKKETVLKTYPASTKAPSLAKTQAPKKEADPTPAKKTIEKISKSIIPKKKSSIADPVIIPSTKIAPSAKAPVKAEPKQTTVGKATMATSAALAAASTKTKSAISDVKAASPTPSKETNAPKEMSLNEKLRQSQGTKTPPKSTVATTTTNTSKATSITKNETTKPFTLSSDTGYTSVPPKKEGLGCLGPFMGLLGILLLCFLLWKGCNCLVDKGGAAKNSATEMLSSDQASDDSSPIESQGGSESSDSSSDTQQIAAEVEECIIITGVFSDYRNVKRMEEKLASYGHNVYTEEYGPHTRVGFRYDCSDEDLPEYLHKIRAQISRKAWYLVPELYVEYR